MQVLRRFTHRIHVGLPDTPARADILRVVLTGERLGGDVDVAALAERTQGYSGSDLKQLCVQAAMRPVREFLEQEGKAVEEVAAEEGGAGAPAEGAAHVQGEAEQQEGDGQALQLPTANGHARSASGASLAGSQHDAAADAEVATPPPPTSSTTGSSGGKSAAASLCLVPRLDSLLRQAERIARLPANPKTDLRPMSMKVSGREAGMHFLRICCLACRCSRQKEAPVHSVHALSVHVACAATRSRLFLPPFPHPSTGL